MLDLTVIILTYNEEIHIRRCLDNIRSLAKDIFIIDSYSTDKTLEIARKYENVRTVQNEWPGNQARQFNWALEHCPIRTEWILRLDADEYLLPELLQEIETKLPNMDENISGIVFKRRHYFLNKWMKRGTYPVKLLRLFRTGKGICEQRFMDEHISLSEGENLEFEHDFCDHNLNNLSWWTAKHNGYAIREAIDLLDIEYGFSKIRDSKFEIQDSRLGKQAAKKRRRKEQYASKPLFLRAFVFFLYRYIFKLGFTEGKEGFLWHFLQCWWYRTLVDAKIFEIKKYCGHNKLKIREYIKQNYNMKV